MSDASHEVTTWTLLRRVSLSKLVRAFSAARGEQWLQYIALGALALAVFVATFAFSAFAFTVLRASGLEELARDVVASVYTGTALALVLLGMGTAVNTLYLSRDLALLMSMPIRMRTILSYKLVEILLADAAAFCVFGLPVLLAYAISFGAGPAYYVLLAPVSGLLLVIPAGLSVLLVLPAKRLLPAGRAREIVAALSGIVGVGVWVGFQVLTTGEGDENALRAVGESPAARVPPGAWAADAITGAATGEWGRVLGGLLPLALAAGSVWVACLAVANREYATGWARSAEGGGTAHGGGWVRVLLAPLPAGMRAVATKDLTAFPRDLRQLANVGSLPFVGLVLAALNRPEAGPEAASAFERVLPFVFAGGFASLTGMQLGLLSVGGEGRAYWLLAVSPLSARHILLGKWTAAFVVGCVAVVLATAAATVFGPYPLGIAVGLGCGLVVAALISAYAVGLSAAFPRFDWDNPQNAITTGARMLLPVITVGLLAWTGLALGLAALLSIWLPIWVGAVVAVAAWVLGAVAPAYGLYRLGLSNLEWIEWEL